MLFSRFRAIFWMEFFYSLTRNYLIFSYICPMEENFNENERELIDEAIDNSALEEKPGQEKPLEESANEPNAIGWRAFFERDDAVRVVYLVFGFFAIVLLMVLLQFFHFSYLLRRLGWLLPHSLERDDLGKHQAIKMASRI